MVRWLHLLSGLLCALPCCGGDAVLLQLCGFGLVVGCGVPVPLGCGEGWEEVVWGWGVV